MRLLAWLSFLAERAQHKVTPQGFINIFFLSYICIFSLFQMGPGSADSYSLERAHTHQVMIFVLDTLLTCFICGTYLVIFYCMSVLGYFFFMNFLGSISFDCLLAVNPDANLVLFRLQLTRAVQSRKKASCMVL